MSHLTKQILLESYDFEKRRKFAIEYSWKAVFRVIPKIDSLPDLYFIAVSDNYVKPKDLQVDITQDVLDVQEVVSAINLRLQDFTASGKEPSKIDEFFVLYD